jgi:hypothetical protein
MGDIVRDNKAYPRGGLKAYGVGSQRGVIPFPSPCVCFTREFRDRAFAIFDGGAKC